MKISDRHKINEPGKTSKQKLEKGAGTKTESAGSSQTVAGEGRVSISSRATEFQKIKSNLLDVPEVREEIVGELKEKIDSGSYHVKKEEVAEGIIKAAIRDKKT